MLTDEQVSQEITNAQEGSDMHGLVGKIAYFLYKRNSARDYQYSADENWYAAQNILLQWTGHPHRTSMREDSVENQIHESLNARSYKHYKMGLSKKQSTDQYADWMLAQDEFADQVLWQQSNQAMAA